MSFRRMVQSDTARLLDPMDLIRVFHPNPLEFGAIQQIATTEIPSHLSSLLIHNHHMTDAMEAYHRSKVDVHVLDTHVTEDAYAREILLKRRSDGEIVQLGLVRLNWRVIPPQVRHEIEQQEKPLGRILAEHQVWRVVQLERLWRVVPDCRFREKVGLTCDVLWGRTARIRVEGESVIELLELAVATSAPQS